MEGIELILRGAAAGFAISAPVGPVNVLCASRTLTKGWFAGFVSSLGAAAADTFYGAIAGFSISFIINFLLREQSKLRVYGGILLILIGVWYYFRRPDKLEKHRDAEPTHSDLVTTFLLNLTNPTTVLSFLAVMAVLGLSERRSPLLTLLVVGGIFAGAMVWWMILIGLIYKLRDKFTDRSFFWMNRIGGIAISAFGLLMIFLGASGRKR
jgi:threonine/homoserine/homoserine lactone efflux protein